MFRDKFWISLGLTIPTLIWGHMLQGALGYTAPHFPGSAWIPVVFGTIVFFYGGWVFVQGAWRELRDRAPGMMTLIALAITVAFVFSVVVTFGYPGMPLWEELATLVTIMLLGHWMEMRSISQAQGALTELAKLLPSTATRLIDGRVEEVPLAARREGDLVLVRDRRGLEDARNVNVVVFDKTGTLTLGDHRVVAMRTDGALSDDEALRLTAAVEQDAEHPVARAIVKSAEERGLALPRASDFQAIPGFGVDAIVKGRRVAEGGPNLLARLGVEPSVFAQVLPGEKAEKIKALQAGGKRVAMVGDGVNDAPALLTANVGVAIGAGTDVAVEAGDIVLVRSDPRDVPRIIALSKATYRKMVQNLWWAAGYNIIAIPLAAGVLQPWGIVLSPAVGAVLMSLSTIIVAVNAQFLRRAEL